MRAAYYLRVSTAGQEDEETIENQKMEVEAAIKNNGDTLDEVNKYVDDGWTGSLLPRPDLDRLRENAKKGLFDVLYVYDRGRIARIFAYQEVVIIELEDLGIKFISLHDVERITDEDRIVQSVQGLFAEYEKVKNHERFRLGKLRKVKDGNLLGYQPKYGYDYHPVVKRNGQKINGYFTINEQEAAVVRKVFHWYDEGTSIYGIIRKLYELGIPTKKGKPKWTKGPIERMLSERTYIGKHHYNKTEAVIGKTTAKSPRYRKVKKTSRKRRPEDEWFVIEGVPAIIEPELFARVQARREQNKKFCRRNNKKNAYLLNGLIECECGRIRTGDPGGNDHTYYRCTNRLSTFPEQRTCFAKGVNAPVLDELVWAKLSKMLTNRELIKKQAAKWLAERNKPQQQDLGELQLRLAKLNAEETRYAKAYGTGVMAESVYEEVMKDVVAQRNKLETAISESQNIISQQLPLTPDELATEAVKMIAGLGFGDRKYVVRQLVDKVIASKEKVTICGHIPLKLEKQVGLNAEYRHSRITECR